MSNEAASALRPAWYSAAGNRFALVDLRARREDVDEGRLARELCAVPRAALGGARADGVLFLRAASAGGDLRLVVRNADGGRAETCGNGLRCVGHHELAAAGTGGSAVVETDAGPRTVRIAQGASGPEIEAQLCQAAATVRIERFETGGLPRRGSSVDAGNPHVVFLVDEPASAPLADWARAIATDARFPRGCNVEVAALRPEGLVARVWERGVGETLSCGSGACAIALASGLGPGPWRVRFPGGLLSVERREGWLWLAGPVAAHGADEGALG